MCEAAEVVGEAVGPYVIVCPSYEVAVFQGVAGHLVNDRLGRAQGAVGYGGDRLLVCAVCFGSYQEAHGVGLSGACVVVTGGEMTGCGSGA